MGERFPVSYLLPYHLAPLPPLLFLIIDAIIEPRLISIVSQHLPHQATQEQETEKQRTRAEWETNETAKQGTNSDTEQSITSSPCRPTPSCGLFLICVPHMVPRPQAWDERTTMMIV